MRAQELLDMLRARGVRLTVDGPNLRATAPAGALDSELGKLLRAHKPELIELLRTPSNDDEQSTAIIGMSCRLPGAPDLDAYWQLLREGRSAVCEIPRERWDYREWFSAEANAPRYMGFLANAAEFDAEFFQISPREARLMDPQHRLFLEVAWETFEHAGVDPRHFAGKAVGVFVGCGGSSYGQLIWSALRPEDYAAGLGTQGFAIPNRTSYFFDFRGPSILVSTACSASLVALHMACESLRRGESELALVGGVNLLLSPAYYLCMAHMGALSPDGSCRTFDRRANGIVLGEGVGALLLKPLAKALRDEDRVLAVLRGSAVNHDGRTNGLSAPNPAAQVALVRAALENAKLAPRDIDYIEAHGTGTALGDPIEVEALAQVFAGLPTGSKRIASVKTNLGHLETAAGVAAVIKVVLALKHGELPPHVGYEAPNPLLSLRETPFVVNDTLTPWRADGKNLRRAGISGFGMGGTNAHVILEEAPTQRPSAANAEPTVITLSAHSEAALRAQQARLREALEARGSISLQNIARTLNAGRAHLPYRRAWVASSCAELIAQLASPDTNFAGHVPQGLPQPALEFEAIGPEQREQTLAREFVHGRAIDWLKLERARGGRVITLPSYSWQHERHWVDVDLNAFRTQLAGGPAHKAHALESTDRENPRTAPLTSVKLLWELWEEQPQEPTKRRVIVLGRAHGFAQQLARALDGKAASLDGDSETLNELLVAETPDGARLDVICVSALDSEDSPAFAETLSATFEPILKLVQALLAARLSPRLWLCTRGAVSVLGEVPSPTQAALWGFARTLMLEHPELECRAIDLDPATLDVAVVARVFARVDLEDQLAVRGSELFRARLVTHASVLTPFVFGAGTVLISGGLGGIGRQLARYFVRRGVKSVALLSRTEPSPAIASELAELERDGARIYIMRCDVAEREDVRLALARLRTEAPPLIGVVHAAGVLDDGLLAQQSLTRFRNVLFPKALGAVHLDQLTREDPLSFFVSFSSIASLVGAPGQANYAAANAFLDALAHAQRARGLRAISIQWGPWAQSGMVERLPPAHIARLQAQGLALLDAETALTALEQALQSNHAEIALLRVDWPKFADSLPPGFVPRVLSRILHSANPGRINNSSSELSELPAEQRLARLEEILFREARKVLGRNDAKPIDRERPLSELGVDSLMAIELKNALSRALGKSLPATLLFDQPTLSAMLRYLETEFSGTAALTHSSERAPTDEPIAIIGVGLRMPGGVCDLESFKRFLYSGHDAIREVPASRWDIDAYYDPDPRAPGKMYARFGSFIDDVEGFDADFFGIAPREALQMDPQQRLLLEVAWEAIEDAGIPVHTLAGSRTGVFLGVGLSGYGQHQLGSDRKRIDAYTATGMITSAAAGRVSYVLGLKGPCLAIDTACSSSLVSVHLACRSLQNGESELALAGGVNLLLSPEGTIMFSKARALSPDGRCKTFDANADGYVRGEGAGILLLKPLSRALAAGDEIYAVIRGSAVNQDGRSAGLTAPNGPSQEAVIRDALSSAGVHANDVAYLEAHGTGTPLGDPIELQAAARVYGEAREATDPLLVGSLKTQIGHLEIAAGVAGILKVLVALDAEELPPHLHFETPNPLIPWADLPVKVTASATAWPPHKPRRAGVSAFGFGGTNAHVIVESWPGSRADGEAGVASSLIVLSAKTKAALQELALRFAEHLHKQQSSSSVAEREGSSNSPNEHSRATFAEICHATLTTRSHFSERLTLIASDAEAAARELEQFAQAAPSRVRTKYGVSQTGEWPQGASLNDLAQAYLDGSVPPAAHPRRGKRPRLPHYPWQRERFWLADEELEPRHWTIAWQAARAPESAARGHFLVLADNSGKASALADELRARGCAVTLVRSREELDNLAGPFAGIVCLVALDANESEPVSAQEDLFETVNRVLCHTSEAPIWFVTANAQSVAPGDACAPAQAAAWGLGRVLALEHPERFGGLIDVDAVTPIDRIAAELGVRGEQVALRGSARFLARLTEQRSPPSFETSQLRLRSDRVYLITGGSGYVGRAIAKWLVSRGAEHIVLASRSGASVDIEGAHVHGVRSDVGRESGVRQVLAHIDALGLKLAGIVHAAGVVEDALLTNHNVERLRTVLRPKVLGALELARQTADRDLEWLLLVSSSAAVLGALGQAAYAAANAYLDAFAHSRSAFGKRTLSVNFGPWAGGGMAARVGRIQQQRWANAGMHLLAKEHALRCLDSILPSNTVQALVANLDLKTLVKALGDRSLPFLEQFAPARASLPTAASPGQEKPSLREAILARPSAERRRTLRSELEARLHKVLGLRAKDIDPDRGFAELGVDSLLALELHTRLSQELGFSLPSTLAIDHPSLRRLTDYLLRRLEEVERTVSVKEAARTDDTSAAIVDRSTEVAPAAPRTFDEPIAIIGMGLRLPGGVHDPESYWKLLREGLDATREVPRERWNIDALYDPDPEKPGRIYTRRGAFLDEVSGFDAAFFGIAPREAHAMDPQQRLLLEIAWEALEHAGHSPTQLRGARAGIFVGIGINDYGTLQGKDHSLERIDAYRGTGNGYCFSAGRLSYHLGLEGPSLAVDTACSSSLVAIHLAVQSLRTGESDIALAGGVHLMLAPETFVLLCRTRALSPDGRCKTFDARADGYGRGEGAALVVLKRLSDAIAAGDRIDALLLGSAVNHDGPASGLTVPNGPAQEAVIRQALERACIRPSDVSYVEAHGTGTALGDPMEVRALANIYASDRSAYSNPLYIGSVKTNIGHLEAASGVAGLLKVVLSLAHEELPAHLHFTDPSSHIAWQKLPIAVPTERAPWQASTPRLAGVSSFGLSGTNAHVIVQEAPKRTSDNDEVAPGPYLFPLSARTPSALQQVAARLAEYLRKSATANLAQVSSTLGRGKAHFEYRRALIAESRDELLQALDRVAEQTVERAPTRARVALVFANGYPLALQMASAQTLIAAGVDVEWLIAPKAEDFVRACHALQLQPSTRESAAESGANTFLELGRRSLLEMCANLYERGLSFDLSGIVPRLPPLALPSYPWQRKRYWFDVQTSARDSKREDESATITCDEADPIIREHRVGGEAVFPAAAHLERLRAHAPGVLLDLVIEAPLRFASGERRATRIGQEGEHLWLESASEHDATFARHVSARIGPSSERTSAKPRARNLETILHDSQTIEGDALYAGMREVGLDYGPLYRRVVRVKLAPRQALAELTAPESRPGYEVHPALLDACLQTFGAASLSVGLKATFVPAAIGRYEVHQLPIAAARLYAYAELDRADETTLSGRVELLDESGSLLLELDRVLFRRTAGSLQSQARSELCLGRVCFVPLTSQAPPDLVYRVISLDEDALADRVRAGLPKPSDTSSRGVIFLCGGASPSFEQALLEVQSIAREMQPTRVWVAARGLAAAPLLGLARTLDLEHPELSCTRITLEASADHNDVVRALSVDQRERELRVSASSLEGARLALTVAPEPNAAWRAPEHGSIVISGGLGALGLEVARWLTARGAQKLILVSRSEPSAEALRTVTELRNTGTSVELIRADVCDEAALRHALGHASIAGFVHAAGVLEDGVLLEQTWQRAERVLRPKRQGADVIAALAREQKPAFVLFFSSTAALLGAAGQGAYAAANAYLDALAGELRADGILATSIQWGPWQGAGMAGRQSPAYLKRLSLLGMSALGSSEAERVLDLSVQLSDAVISALSIDRKLAREALRSGLGSALFDELAPPREHASQTAELRKRLSRLAPLGRRQELEALVHAQAARVLQLDPNELIDIDVPLAELGMDSLMAIEVRNGLGAALNQAFPASLLFDRPTIRSLVDLLESEFGRVASRTEQPRASVANIDEQVAVIGIGCRFPGGADNPELFWQLLANGVDAVSEVPRDRFNVDDYFAEDPEAPGKMYSRHGGFVRDLDRFDAHFFGISAIEAKSLDPQQRLLLEVCWEALENAGIIPSELAGSETGVFVGIGASGYASAAMKAGDLSQIDAYAATGNTSSAAVGRLSYTLGLEGPNVSIDTACSSSLVALHLACQSLRLGESQLALAGGVNVLLSPEVSVMVSKARMLSPEGRCKAFDAAADGYVRSEGAGLVVLKRLGDALRDGDRIWGVIRGTAVNQDGRSSGLTAPNGRAQEAVIRRALKASAIAAHEVSYVEAHGTGTALGDPLELTALQRALDSKPERSLCVGSVKTNIGHLEIAAGVAGLIKVLLAFKHGALPGNLHFRTPNPHLRWDELGIEIVSALRPWQSAGTRIAGLSSFGFSGTNAHAILEQPPETAPPPSREGPGLILVTARSSGALRALAASYADWLREHTSVSVADLAHAIHSTRARHELRLAVVARTRDEAIAELSRFAAGDDSNIAYGRVLPVARRKVMLECPSGTDAATQTLERDAWSRWGVPLVESAELKVSRPNSAEDAEFQRLCELARIVVQGVEPDWNAVNGRTGKLHLELPTYPWQRQRFWLDEPEARITQAKALEHPLLRAGKARISLSQMAILSDHRVHGRIVVPAAVLLELALAHTQADALEDVTLSEALTLSDADTAELTVRIDSDEFKLTSTEDDTSDDSDPVHMSARSAARVPAKRDFDWPALQARCPNVVPVESFYRALAEHGMLYGPAFQTLSQLAVGDAEAIAELKSGTSPGFLLDPTVLDGALQLLGAALATCGTGEVRLPVRIARLSVASEKTSALAYAHARVILRDDDAEGSVHLFDKNGELALELTGVQLRVVPEGLLEELEKVRIARHTYELAFRELPPVSAERGASLARTRCAVLLDDAGLGLRLAARLEDAGAEVLRVADAKQLTGASCDAVVCLNALDADALTRTPLPALTASYVPVLDAIKALRGSPHLILVTRGAVRALPSDATVSVFQSPLWGLGRSIAVERPELQPVLLDGDPEHAEDLLAQIIETVSANDGETQIAYRQGRRFVARLERTGLRRSRSLKLQSDASYLITGGTGALGLHAVEELVRSGARHVLLIARREPDSAALTRIQEFESAGATVRVAQADVTDKGALESVIASLEYPLRGIVHTAGRLEDALLDKQDQASFERTIAPKVLGALHLRSLTRQMPLDFVIYYSSTAGLFGASGQANYAAANACLDALAALERSEGRNALSIAWGAWSGGGMATQTASARRSTFGALSPSEGRAALALALEQLSSQNAQSTSSVAFTKIRKHRLARVLGKDRPAWLSLLLASDPQAQSELANELMRLDLPAREQRIAERLREELRRTLGLGELEPIHSDTEFTSLGVDSLLSIEVPNVLGRIFGISFPSTLLREYPTLAALSRHIAEKLETEQPTARNISQRSSVLRLKRASARPPLICLGGAPGDALYLQALARELTSEQPFYALEAPGLDGQQPPLRTVQEIAAHHLRELERAGLNGPYLLAGHSFGGFVAFEMARQLRAARRPVDFLALFDSVGVDWNDAALPFTDDWIAGELSRVLFYTLGERRKLTWAELNSLPAEKRVIQLIGGEGSEAAIAMARRLISVMKANLEAMVRYRVTGYDGKLHLFRASEQLDGVLADQFTYGSERDFGWSAATNAPVFVHDVPGNHFSMMSEPHVSSLARALNAVLGLAKEAAE